MQIQHVGRALKTSEVIFLDKNKASIFLKCSTQCFSMPGDDKSDQTDEGGGNADIPSSENKDSVIPVSAEDSSTIVPLSNKQRKKLLKRQKWLEQKPQRKAKEKEKRKLKILQARETGQDLGPSRKLLKSQKMSDSTCKLRICFDLTLADVMTEQEFSKTFKQLHRCYSINRRAAAPLQLHIAGYSDATKSKMETRSGCFNWDINFDPAPYSELFAKDQLIYLTSDSPNEIEELDYGKTYVIGALVDHNRLKNICYERAQEEGVPHARLPLDAHFKFKTRKVLTIDQVYSIFLRLSEGRSWVDAVMDTVPKRKGVELKSDVSESGQNSDSNDFPCDKSTESLSIENNTEEVES